MLSGFEASPRHFWGPNLRWQPRPSTQTRPFVCTPGRLQWRWTARAPHLSFVRSTDIMAVLGIWYLVPGIAYEYYYWCSVRTRYNDLPGTWYRVSPILLPKSLTVNFYGCIFVIRLRKIFCNVSDVPRSLQSWVSTIHTSAVSMTDWIVETQLCTLRGTPDTFVGRAYSIFHLSYSGVCFLWTKLTIWLLVLILIFTKKNNTEDRSRVFYV